MSVRLLAALVVGLLCVGCAARPVTSGGLDGSLRAAIRSEGLAVAPIVALADVPPPVAPAAPGAASSIEAGLRTAEAHLPPITVLDPADPRDGAFLRNEYIGNIRFGGGFIRTGSLALEVRARQVELGAEAAYRAQGVRWLDGAVQAALAGARVSSVRSGPAVAPVPERHGARGLNPEDGSDNLNLPRLDLAPVSLDAAQQAAAVGNRWLLVPYLRLYWAHNGGWFLGQTFGCTAGARVEAFVVLYDVPSGRPVWWMTAEGRSVLPMRAQASTAEIDQALLWAEGAAAERLTRGFLR